MNSHVSLCLMAFVAVAMANPPALNLLPVAPIAIEKYSHPSYSFNYAVNDPSTGDNKGQWETRDGDVVHGAYSLVEPDGNVRLVEYTADSLHGFNAVVKRTGPNIHSVGLPVAAPVVEKIAPLAPIAHVAPIANIAPIGHLEPLGEIAPLAPTFDLSHYGGLYGLDGPLLGLGNWGGLDLGPWVSVKGSTYGEKGHLVRRWAAGPISLDGQKITIRTKH